MTLSLLCVLINSMKHSCCQKVLELSYSRLMSHVNCLQPVYLDGVFCLLCQIPPRGFFDCWMAYRSWQRLKRETQTNSDAPSYFPALSWSSKQLLFTLHWQKEKYPHFLNWNATVEWIQCVVLPATEWWGPPVWGGGARGALAVS